MAFMQETGNSEDAGTSVSPSLSTPQTSSVGAPGLPPTRQLRNDLGTTSLHSDTTRRPEASPRYDAQNVSSMSERHTAHVPPKTEPAGSHSEQKPLFLGLPAYQGHGPYVTDRSYDYARKYPPDEKGKELDPDGRFWKVYLDESESYDNDMVKGFRDTTDATLVFAALFSSVVTGFIIESGQRLEPDYGLINATMLLETNRLLRAGGNASQIEAVPQSSLGPESVTHSSLDVCASWMFFASLSLSLAAALLSILVKQWLQAFTTLVSGDAKERSLVRQFRFAGLRKWKLSEIVNILPLFLHFSLALFLIGLCLFVQPFHSSIFAIVCFFTGASFVFYFVTALLPGVYPDCPYRLTILYIPARFVVHLFRALQSTIRPDNLHLPISFSPLLSEERWQISMIVKELEASCIAWLFDQTTNESVQEASFHCATEFLRPSITGLYTRQPEIRVAKLLPLTELSSFTLRSIPPTEPKLEDGNLSLDFLLRCCAVDPTSIPPNAWHIAIHTPQLLDTFLKYGVPLDVTFRFRSRERSPLQHACFMDQWEAAKLLAPGSPPHHLTPALSQFSPLGLACRSTNIGSEGNRLLIIDLFLDHSANAAAIDEYGHTAIHQACYAKTPQVEVLKALISSVPKIIQTRIINHPNIRGVTPLHFACRWRSFPVIDFLLSVRANPNVQDEEGRSPLHDACHSFFDDSLIPEHFPAFERIIVATQDINVLSKVGDTPLDELVKRHGSSEGYEKFYQLMLQHGAKQNSTGAVESRFVLLEKLGT